MKKIIKQPNKKYICDDCDEEFSSKKELIEHLWGEFDEASETLENIVTQLDFLHIKHP